VVAALFELVQEQQKDFRRKKVILPDPDVESGLPQSLQSIINPIAYLAGASL
jgi:hypothetical protein